MKKIMALALLALALLAAMTAVHAEPIGEVNTTFKLLGPDNKIKIEAYDDPSVQGVACYVSRAVTGGLSGMVGLATDKTEVSIACRKVGPISFKNPLPKQEDMFTERMSVLFKKLHVVRLVDSKRNALVYMTYSDTFIEGSPKNSVTAVAIEDSNVIIPVK